MLSMQQLADKGQLNAKKVLIRVDLNVPLQEGRVTSEARIDAVLETIHLALEHNAAVILMSHLGRPTEGSIDAENSLQPVAFCLARKLNRKVTLVKDYLIEFPEVVAGDVVLLENVRFNSGEKANDSALAKQYAALCDVFVMDAFATAHRAQASTCGVAEFADKACAGPLLVKELAALDSALSHPERPMVAIVGGSKVSTKLVVLDQLAKVVDQLIPGGGIANTFIAAAGYNVGKSLFEPDLVEETQKLIAHGKAQGKEIPIPVDVVVAKEFDKNASAEVKAVDSVADDDMILDVGPKTAAQYAQMMKKAKTIVWNGPVGVFEFPQFAEGTKQLGQAIAESTAFSLAGGGDTVSAIETFHWSDKISYISTGGGAFLEYLEGKTLPAVKVLEDKSV